MCGEQALDERPSARSVVAHSGSLSMELEHQAELGDLEQRALDDVGSPDEDYLDDDVIVGGDAYPGDREQILEERI